MAFHDVRLELNPDYGTRGGPGWNTAIIENDAGYEYRVGRWSSSRRQYDLSYAVRDRDDLATLLEFAEARRGSLHSFRFKDWTDYTTASNHRDAPGNDQTIGTGDASETQFQLIKVYSSGGHSTTRNITRPVSGTTRVYIDSVEQLSGWTVNSEGVVTFSTAPGAGEVVSAGCEFDVEVRFGAGVDEALRLGVEGFDTGSASGLTVVEVRNSNAAVEHRYGGGASSFSISADYQLALSEGMVQAIEPTTSGLSVHLPTHAAAPYGSPILVIINESTTDALSLKEHTDDGGTQIVSIAAEQSVIVMHGKDVDDNGVWFAR